MKRFVFISILLFITSILQAQNWQPVSENCKYHYKFNNSTLKLNTIQVDSMISLENNQIQYFLNRVVAPCDTCPGYNNYNFMLKNQPQFLMREMIKVSDNQYIFRDTLEFSIAPLTKTGETFVFSEVPYIEASVFSEGIEVVLGQADSVKNIHLSNGQFMVISKNYGIVSMQDFDGNSYELVGFENNDLVFGETVSNFNDYFDYNVGDTIQQYIYEGMFGGPPDCSYTTRKFGINTKEIRNDTTFYKISGMYYTWGDFSPIISAGYFTDSIFFVNSINSMANAYDMQFIYFTDAYNYEGFSYLEEFCSFVTFSQASNYTIKFLGFEDISFNNLYFISYTNEDLLMNANMEYSITYKLLPIMGGWFDALCFEYERSDYNMGIIKDGITYGTVYNNSVFENYISVNELKFQNMAVYPNPVERNGVVGFQNNETMETFTIYNLSGQPVQSGTCYNNEIQLNLTASGIYFIQLKTGNTVYYGKMSVL